MKLLALAAAGILVCVLAAVLSGDGYYEWDATYHPGRRPDEPNRDH